MADRRAQQIVDLQNRITELVGQCRLDLLTDGEVALISYALGRYHAELLEEMASRREGKPGARAIGEKGNG